MEEYKLLDNLMVIKYLVDHNYNPTDEEKELIEDVILKLKIL